MRPGVGDGDGVGVAVGVGEAVTAAEGLALGVDTTAPGFPQAAISTSATTNKRVTQPRLSR